MLEMKTNTPEIFNINELNLQLIKNIRWFKKDKIYICVYKDIKS